MMVLYFEFEPVFVPPYSVFVYLRLYSVFVHLRLYIVFVLPYCRSLGSKFCLSSLLLGLCSTQLLAHSLHLRMFHN